MNAMSPIPGRTPLGVDVLLIEGRAIRLAEIETADEGRRLLDLLDTDIDRIEGQISAAAIRGGDPEWLRSVGIAHSRKRRIRPRLQERIGELRRAEERRAKASAAAAVAAVTAARTDGRRRAFILAARELLGHEIVTEVWARAAELKPDAFVDGIPDGGAS